MQVGQRVRKTDSADYGVVRYVGELSGTKGEWIGVELDAPRGRSKPEPCPETPPDLLSLVTKKA